MVVQKHLRATLTLSISFLKALLNESQIEGEALSAQAEVQKKDETEVQVALCTQERHTGRNKECQRPEALIQIGLFCCY